MDTASTPPTDTPVSVRQWLADLQRAAPSERLGKGSARMLSLLAQEPEFASYASTGELAARADIHASSATRVSQALGFEGWPALRAALRKVYIHAVESPLASSAPNGDDASVIDATLAGDVRALTALRTSPTREHLADIATAITQARRTVIVGSGLAAVPAHVIGYLGLIGGLEVATAFGSATEQIAFVSRLTAGDCLIAINIWRTTDSLKALVDLAHERGATVCVLTDVAGSRLEEHATHVAVTPLQSVDGAPSPTAMAAAAFAIVHSALPADAAVRGRAVERAWDAAGLMNDAD